MRADGSQQASCQFWDICCNTPSGAWGDPRVFVEYNASRTRFRRDLSRNDSMDKNDVRETYTSRFTKR